VLFRRRKGKRGAGWRYAVRMIFWLAILVMVFLCLRLVRTIKRRSGGPVNIHREGLKPPEGVERWAAKGAYMAYEYRGRICLLRSDTPGGVLAEMPGSHPGFSDCGRYLLYRLPDGGQGKLPLAQLDDR
jgi:hypothetical protein